MKDEVLVRLAFLLNGNAISLGNRIIGKQ